MLHIGRDYVIPTKDIVAILDARTMSAKDTQRFFDSLSPSVVVKIDEDYTSLVLTSHNYVQKLYLSPISCATLLKRSGKPLKEL